MANSRAASTVFAGKTGILFSFKPSAVFFFYILLLVGYELIYPTSRGSKQMAKR